MKSCTIRKVQLPHEGVESFSPFHILIVVHGLYKKWGKSNGRNKWTRTLFDGDPRMTTYVKRETPNALRKDGHAMGRPSCRHNRKNIHNSRPQSIERCVAMQEKETMTRRQCSRGQRRSTIVCDSLKSLPCWLDCLPHDARFLLFHAPTTSCMLHENWYEVRWLVQATPVYFPVALACKIGHVFRQCSTHLSPHDWASDHMRMVFL